VNTLRKYRMGYGYRQDKLAARVFISPGYLCDLEHDLKKPSPRLARAIADIFGAKVEAVFPDGCAEKVCRQRAVDTDYYCPPTLLPPPLVLRCWKCGAVRINHRETCYACGAEFKARPMEGVHV